MKYLILYNMAKVLAQQYDLTYYTVIVQHLCAHADSLLLIALRLR
ncbi:Uncharacterised protein [Streptococcus pneumoniae]|nr:Uncharacterised protein [Streptococcus pneumoniae]